MSDLHRLVRLGLSFLWSLCQRLAGVPLLLLRFLELIIFNHFFLLLNGSFRASARLVADLDNFLWLTGNRLSGWLRFLRSLAFVNWLLLGDCFHNRSFIILLRLDKQGSSWFRSLSIISLGEKCLFNLQLHLSIKLLFNLFDLRSNNSIDFSTQKIFVSLGRASLHHRFFVGYLWRQGHEHLIALLPIVHHKEAIVLDLLELVFVAQLILFVHFRVLFLVVITQKLPSATKLLSNLNQVDLWLLRIAIPWFAQLSMIVLAKVEEGCSGSLGNGMHHALRDFLFFLTRRHFLIVVGCRITDHLSFNHWTTHGRFILHLIFNSLVCLSIRLHGALLFSFVISVH